MTKQEIYMLFAPKSARGLKFDYPELTEYPELNALNRRELLFVWYYACKSSPYYNLKKKEREIIDLCAKKADMIFKEPAKKEKFLTGDFGEDIQAGIAVMNSFEPAARIYAKVKAMQHYLTVDALTSIKLDENGNHADFIKDDEIDMSKKKSYMEMVLKANKELGDMLKKAERGFGITSGSKKVNDKNLASNGNTFAEEWHENK